MLIIRLKKFISGNAYANVNMPRVILSVEKGLVMSTIDIPRN